MDSTLARYTAIAESIERLFHPYAEVVLHDIEQNKIAAIYNPISQREVGGDSLLTKEELNFKSDSIGPYAKRNWDGRKLKSISTVIRDDQQRAVGLLSINFDISQFAGMSERLTSFIEIIADEHHDTLLFEDDWQEKINKYVTAYLAERQLTIETLKREGKKQLVEHLYHQGAFSVKHAAQYIASIIGVSRATVYNYLHAMTDGQSRSES